VTVAPGDNPYAVNWGFCSYIEDTLVCLSQQSTLGLPRLLV
jgi:hypothetical protein